MEINKEEEDEIYHKEKEVYQKAHKNIEEHLKKQDFHKKSVDDIAKQFSTDLKKGLTSDEADKRLEKFGLNELESKEKESLWEKIKEQFDDLLVKILLAAAVISFIIALTDDKDEGIAAYVEPIVILLILIANAIIGIAQDNNADKAIEALMDMQALECKVLRDGKWKEMDAKNLVPGDVVEVHLGDKTPADLRCAELKSVSLQIEEASLTGESKAVNKQTEIVNTNSNLLPDRKNILFSSTIVTYGSAVGIVVSTGMDTAIGSIQKEVQAAEEDEEDTPLKKKLDHFGEVLSYMIGAICFLVWIMNYSNFDDPIHGGTIRGCIYYFKIAIALAVAAIPEGLPAVITTCLALGTRKMAQNNAIVRSLPSVQTLGCTTVICSDKTGTLTKNEMSATNFYYCGNSVNNFVDCEVEDTTYHPIGNISISNDHKNKYKNLLLDIATVATINNHSDIKFEEGEFIKYGAPTEVALKVLSEKIAALYHKYDNHEDKPCQFFEQLNMRKEGTLEFDSNRKMMSTIVSGFTQDHPKSLLQKGATERIIDQCKYIRLGNGQQVELTKQNRESLKQNFNKIAANGLRCIGLAAIYDGGELGKMTEQTKKEMLSNFAKYHDYESGGTFLGVAAIKDPLREQVPDSIQKCKEAGIRVMMITGDNKNTAEAIARDAGILVEGQKSEGSSFTGTEFEALTHEDKVAAISGHGGKVFSRVEPRHKRELVKLLTAQGEIVAMTGDGVNDAPALKQAAIGVAMGITGTEVAKEASDMILTDDNFATIVTAVEQGRSIYSNMQAFIRYLISSNIGEVASIFMTATLGIPEGFTSVQLLWINLVTDGPPATALGFNPPDKDIMKKPPRDPSESLLSNWVLFRYMVIGMYVGAATVGIFIYWYCYDDFGDGHSLVTLNQLRNWSECPDWGKDFNPVGAFGMTFKDPCEYFTIGKVKASTLSLSCLVMLEMLNALNALSENGSLVQMPPWINPWLLLAIAGSIAIHVLIIYIPFFADIFGTCYMTGYDWLIVMIFSIPVILIDEVLKFFARIKANMDLKKRLRKVD